MAGKPTSGDPKTEEKKKDTVTALLLD